MYISGFDLYMNKYLLDKELGFVNNVLGKYWGEKVSTLFLLGNLE